jgi:acyl-homoserine-lactone acylase
MSAGLLTAALLSLLPAPNQEGTEILWDTFGVPHIFADDPEGLFYASGWAQMHNHGNLMLRLYGQARGRASEYWGAAHVASDRWVRTMGIPARGRDWNQRQDPVYREFLAAFARGINGYAREHPEQIDAEVKPVLPVVPADILAHFQRVIHFTFVVDQRTATGLGRAITGGSNAWAIAPSRSASGNALLLANPHLPWGDFFTWMELQLTAPGINAYGVTLVGLPALLIAFNDHLGWTHTVNTHDGADFYELTTVAEGYRWDGGIHNFGEADQTFVVRLPDGSFRDETLIVKRSVHGPVVAEGRGKALALRVVGLDRPHIFEHYWNMLRATNLAEFEAALHTLQNPMFTVMYADRDGHIMHLFGGLTPIRPEGDYNWNRTVPGDSSATLWTETHPYEDLPRVVDPPSGWLQNSNDPPWTTTFPRALDPDDFPRYMAPRHMSFRAQRSARMLTEDQEISLDEMIQYKHSTRMELADRLLDDLLPAAREHGNDLTRQAAEVLQAWDRRADAGSRGAILFQAFVGVLNRQARGNPFSVPWSSGAPRTTPDGLAAPAAAAALAGAAEQVLLTHGRLDVAWGDVYRLRGGGVDLPASGGPGSLGIFRVLGFRQTPDGRFAAASGDSYVAAIEFSDPVRAWALLSYGNASQPGSPHRTDQLALLSRNELRPVWRRREEIEQHLEKREVF